MRMEGEATEEGDGEASTDRQRASGVAVGEEGLEDAGHRREAEETTGAFGSGSS